MSNSLFKDSRVTVEELLKKSKIEKTEKIYLRDSSNKRHGPFIRKTINLDSGIGEVYIKLYDLNARGKKSSKIPEVFHVKKSKDKLVVIEEFIEGVALDKFLARQNFDKSILDNIFMQLCEAVDFLHTSFSSPVIHRDIKPSNILIDKSNNVFLIDFGISREYNNEKGPDTHKFGTVGYAAPEQFGYQQTDVRSDVYAIGKVLEFCCNAKNWNTASNDCDDCYKEIIQKATEFDPKQRFKNVKQLVSAYKKVISFVSVFQSLEESKLVIILGHVWNLLLLATFVFLTVATISVAFTPSDTSYYNSSLFEKICIIITILAFIVLPVTLMLMYKPSLRKIFKKLPKIGFKYYLVFIAFCCAGILLFGAISQIFA